MVGDDKVRLFRIDWRLVSGASRDLRQRDVYDAMRQCAFRHIDRIDITRVTVHNEQEQIHASSS